MLTSEQMFLNLSPLAAHLNESLCSLRFATKASIQKSWTAGDECAADALRWNRSTTRRSEPQKSKSRVPRELFAWQTWPPHVPCSRNVTLYLSGIYLVVVCRIHDFSPVEHVFHL
jgi:hypothetical protein